MWKIKDSLKIQTEGITFKDKENAKTRKKSSKI